MLVTHHAPAKAPAPAPHDLFSVVNSQLVAFRSSDFRRAYGNAAAAVQQKFTLQQFELMIRHNYPDMTRLHRIEFGFVKVDGATALVQVFFFAADGSVRPYLYSLVAEDSGWKVESVEPMRAPPPGHRLGGLHV
jgi:hypothetical protein